MAPVSGLSLGLPLGLESESLWVMGLVWRWPGQAWSCFPRKLAIRPSGRMPSQRILLLLRSCMNP